MHIRFFVAKGASLRLHHHRNSLFLALAALLILFLAACGGGSNSNTPPQSIQVAVSPATASVFTSQAKTFTATVTGSSNTAVSWSLQEGSAGGSVSGTGVYTAPATAGTFHVIATSQADTTKTAIATVTVPGAAPAPTFTSTAPTTAAEGQSYSYTIIATDPAGGTVSFQLTSGPTNASISGSVLTWTPGHAQSRIPNSFTITATTSEQATATQTFTVTPNGNINGVINIIDYTTNGKTIVPSTNNGGVVAFVPDGNGSYTQITGTTSSGAFTIPSVPAGNVMIQLGVGSLTSTLLWTNASDVDFSNPFQGRLNASYPQGNVTIDVNFTMSVFNSQSINDCYLFIPNLGQYAFVRDSNLYNCSATWNNTLNWFSPMADPTMGDQTYVYQRQPVANLLNNTWTGGELIDFSGPLSLTIPNGGTVNLSGNITAPGANNTVRANLAISQFVSLTGGISPNFSGFPVFTMNVQPFTSDYYLNLGPVNESSDNETIAPLVLYPYSQSFNTDADLGDVTYSNPFPAGWPVYAAIKIQSQLSYNADGATTYPLQLWAGIGTLTLNLPTSGSPIVPLVGPATSIKINGNDFFQPQPSAGAEPVVTWNPPSVGTPDGYSLNIVQLKNNGYGITLPGNQFSIYTTQTSVTVPPGILQSGYAYVFQLQAFKGNGNVEQAPQYASFPWGYADAFSGVVHVGP